MSKYQKLLEPGYIGPVRTRSRMIRGGANPGFYPYEDGNVPQQIIDFYEALAAGGIGLVTTGTGEIDWPIGTVPGQGYRIDEDRFIPSLQRLAGAIHKHDCPAFIQLFHMGPMHPQVLSGHQPIAASSLPQDEIPVGRYFVAREMTGADIERVKGKFIEAAVRAQKAGFDGIELNGACNHLLNSFLSGFWNRRTDEYGGSVENRARFMVEVLKGIKEATGKDFAVVALINGLEIGLKDGITLEESKAFARLLEAAGADAIHVRCEFYYQPRDYSKRDSTHFPDMLFYPELPDWVVKEYKDVLDLSRHGAGCWTVAAAEIKKAVSIPVIAVGRMDAALGEKLIGEGMIDFININRRLLADHEYPRKIAEGREEDIAPCTACMTCFVSAETGGQPRCRINAAFGKEKEYEIKPAAVKKKIMIVGGGPAGMEAARVAALRGHEVELYDKINRLGGSMLVAATVKGTEKEDLIAIIRYLETQLKKLGVKVTLNKEVTPELVEQVKPDVLVLATGAKHNIPDIPGIKGDNVVTSEQLHHQLKAALKFAGPERLRSLTRLYMPVAKDAIVIGAGLQGCQTAEFLIKRGRKATIVDSCPEDKIGDGLVEVFMKPFLLEWLDEKGVKVFAEVKLEEITRDGLVITTREGRRMTLTARSIVTAMPLKPDTEIVEEMKSKANEVYVIGDAREPGLIVDAIADGSRIGRQI
ncbi:FAD-dependent oxidoreductase [Moorella sulfitireducens]|uniref:oxidoreductase n=1 Tax=Neomoorella sulfitireducens TaxID=2972948 RepID=UPI0021ABB984|nr:FAD-dependent oxidoreductase [Moorella sulfitireducens]